MQFLSNFRKTAYRVKDVQQGKNSLSGKLLLRNQRSFIMEKAQIATENDKNHQNIPIFHVFRHSTCQIFKRSER